MSENSTLPPILLIHGAWHGKWCYETYFCDYLQAQGFETHAIDLPHHGEKFSGQAGLRWRSINEYVEAVDAYAKTLARPPILVGHSMGGLVTQKYLERHHAPAGVLLASVPVSGVWRTAFNMLRHLPLRFLKANLTLSLYPFIDSEALVKEHFFSADIAQSDLETYFSKMHDESYRAFLDMLLLNLPKPNNVTTPLLVMGAENDTVFSVKEVEATARAYGTEAIIFKDMAHDMMLERDWQAVADKIVEWVNHVVA